MVNITDVRVSNAAFKASHTSLVAVFVGATSGIGLATLKLLAEVAVKPRLHILGRSKSSSSTLLADLKKINPHATINFIETEISLIKNVDIACEEIVSKENRVDILFLTPGGISLGGRNESTEGIDIALALQYYSRLRFVYNLLPLLDASESPRVIAILAGGKERNIDINDLECKNKFDGIKAAGLSTTQTTLAFEELAKTHPKISFIHKYPGLVATGAVGKIFNTVPGVLAIPAKFATWLLVPTLNLFSMSREEAGERGLFLSTSARYPPTEPHAPGVALSKGEKVAKSTVVTDGKGNGVYTLNERDDTAPESCVLPGYRERGIGKVIWEETQAVWDRAIGKSG